MFSNNTKSELDLLKSRVKKLEFDLKWPKLTIDTHCSNIKSKIDFQTELMHQKIDEERMKLIQEVDEYQEGLFQDLDSRIDKSKVEAVLIEIQEFIKSEPTQIDLIQQQLNKVKLEEKSFEDQIFLNTLYYFRPTENPGELLGNVWNRKLKSPISVDEQTTDYRLVEFADQSLISS
jgi:hypothetical protein